MELKASFTSDLDFADIDLKKVYIVLQSDTSTPIRTLWDNSLQSTVITGEGTKMEMVINIDTVVDKTGEIEFQFIFGGSLETGAESTSFYSAIQAGGGLIQVRSRIRHHIH